MIEDNLNNALVRINKPLIAFQVEFEKDIAILNLFYEVNKNGKKVSLKFNIEKSDTIESVFDALRPFIIKEYLQTHF